MCGVSSLACLSFFSLSVWLFHLTACQKGVGLTWSSTSPLIFTLARIPIRLCTSWTIFPLPYLYRLWPIEEEWLGVTEKRRGNAESWHHSGRGKGWTAQISPSSHCQQTQGGFVGRGIQLISGLKWASVQNRSGCGGYHLQKVGDHMQLFFF